MQSLAKELTLASADHLSLAMETNGKGFHGFIVELPGAFVRGPSEEEAVSKAQGEAESYLRWLGQKRAQSPRVRIVQTLQCRLTVEDADCEILLADDKQQMSDQEFRLLAELAKYSGITFNTLFDSAKLKDWVDEARIRTTFYGQNKKTIREIFDHVKQTQCFYISRTGLSLNENREEPFMRMRDLSLETLASLFRKSEKSKIYTLDGEDWTLKKILRRFIWHDRIHGKAIVRILEKQRQLRLVDSYEDPFKFNIDSATSNRFA